jgi:hypothetical protein
MKALGRVFDLANGFVPVDTQTGANTGKRVNLKNAQGVSFVFFKGAGTGTDVPVFTLQEHTANTGGTSQNLAAITAFHSKSATTLAGTEAWSTTTQAAAATLTLTGEATKQGIYVIEIAAASLSDTFTHVSLSVADTGAAGAQLGCLLYVLHDLIVQRKPANLAATL